MAFFPHQHFKREGAKQTAVCDWCGQWVDVQDLILCDVEGFRGYYVCSSHPWEKDKRVKPSFLDRGGVGQVIDPGHDMLPAPGAGGLLSTYSFTMLNLDSVSVAPASYAATAANVGDYSNADFTVECLIYLGAYPATLAEIVNVHDVSTNQGWRLTITDAGILRLFRGATDARTSSAVSLNALHRISVTHTAAGIVAMFVDGEAVAMADTSVGTTVMSVARPFVIGAGETGIPGTSIATSADIRFFGAVRSAAEINAFWRSYLPPTGVDDLIANWLVSEGTGSLLSETVTGLNMAVVGGAGWTAHSISTGLP